MEQIKFQIFQAKQTMSFILSGLIATSVFILEETIHPCVGLVCCMYWTGVLYVLDWCVVCTGLVCCMDWTGVLYVYVLD